MEAALSFGCARAWRPGLAGQAYRRSCAQCARGVVFTAHLSGRQRSRLRSLGGRREQQGQLRSFWVESAEPGSWTPRFLQDIEQELAAAGIVKIRMKAVVSKRKEAAMVAESMAAALCGGQCAVAQVLGHTALLYKLGSIAEVGSHDEPGPTSAP